MVNFNLPLMPLAFPQKDKQGSKPQPGGGRQGGGGRWAAGRWAETSRHVLVSRLVVEGLLPACGGLDPGTLLHTPQGLGPGRPAQRAVQTQAWAVPRLRKPGLASLSNHILSSLRMRARIRPSRRSVRLRLGNPDPEDAVPSITFPCVYLLILTVFF